MFSRSPISIHSPRMGRDQQKNILAACKKISIHSPRMGRDWREWIYTHVDRYFNPLSPHGERPVLVPVLPPHSRFQSTLPAWGETRVAGRGLQAAALFQSTLPAWGETYYRRIAAITITISIHSPRMGRDGCVGCRPPARVISIHSPRMGRDPINLQDTVFSSISIHSPRMGRDIIC